MFHCFNGLNRFSVWYSKKILWNSDDMADQITGRNDDTLGAYFTLGASDRLGASFLEEP